MAGGALFQDRNPRERHCAGIFVTRQNEGLLFNADGTPTERTKKILAATPMERFGKPEELLGALLFFAVARRLICDGVWSCRRQWI